MRTANQILVSKILSDIRTLVTLVILASVVSATVAYAWGYADAAHDSYHRFKAMIDERD